MRLCSSCLTVPSKRGLIFCGLYDTLRFGTPSCGRVRQCWHHAKAAQDSEGVWD